MGQILVMGRKTFESIGKPLPGRETVVLSRSGFKYPGVRVLLSLQELDPTIDSRDFFICGGAQIYQQALPHCSDLYLTLVKREVEGDVLFPPFEDYLELQEKLQDGPDFDILHYVEKNHA